MRIMAAILLMIGCAAAPGAPARALEDHYPAYVLGGRKDVGSGAHEFTVAIP